MATLKCRCGTLLRDDDVDDGLFLFTRHDYDVDLDSMTLLGRAREVWKCRTCGRLWIFWQPDANPTEYLPAHQDDG